MKQAQTPNTDYSRYFSIKQKAYLINMSEERDREQYDSLSGFIVNRRGNVIELQIPYMTDQGAPDASSGTATYKLTTESLGVGLQMIADLVNITEGNIFHLQLRGNLEIYQRRQTPRIELSLKLYNLHQDYSLTAYRKEFKRATDYVKSQGGLPHNIILKEVPVNLSVGGIRLTYDADVLTYPLSLFFIDVDDNLAPVCAVAELVWNRLEDSKRSCGYRFIHILKNDQERINRFVMGAQKKMGIKVVTQKVNWELLDRMTFEEQGQNR